MRTSTTWGVSGKPAATAAALGVVGGRVAQTSSMLMSSPSGSALIATDRSQWSSGGRLRIPDPREVVTRGDPVQHDDE